MGDVREAQHSAASPWPAFASLSASVHRRPQLVHSSPVVSTLWCCCAVSRPRPEWWSGGLLHSVRRHDGCSSRGCAVRRHGQPASQPASQAASTAPGRGVAAHTATRIARVIHRLTLAVSCCSARAATAAAAADRHTAAGRSEAGGSAEGAAAAAAATELGGRVVRQEDRRRHHPRHQPRLRRQVGGAQGQSASSHSLTHTH